MEARSRYVFVQPRFCELLLWVACAFLLITLLGAGIHGVRKFLWFSGNLVVSQSAEDSPVVETEVVPSILYCLSRV